MRILITGGSGFIGTNLIEKLRTLDRYTILNLDNSRPASAGHDIFWTQCDILDSARVSDIFQSFNPQAVIHLAALTDTDPKKSLADYAVNTIGTENILNAIQESTEVERVIITSTQFVHQYKGLPKHDEDFAPHTVYGESKVIMEKMTRNIGLKCVWTIIRPTNIWGPWHIRYPYEFWKVLSKGLYVHPGKKPVVRSYGYVGNVVHQMIAILESPAEKVNHEVFYVGDEPIDIYHWVNGFSVKQTGKEVRIVPRILLRSLALAGDLMLHFNISFPLTTSRYKSMTNSNIAPMEKTFRTFGPPPYSLEEGIEETVNWMKQNHPGLVKVRKNSYEAKR